MFGKPIELFEIFGFKVRIDFSWFVVAALVTWQFSVQVFPAQLPGLAAGTYWLMGTAGALAYFLAILLHEMSHALMARAYGVEIRGITLFIFGGVAEMAGEPPSW